MSVARPVIHPLSAFSIPGSDTRHATQSSEPSSSATSTSTVLGPLPIHQLQDHHQPAQFQYLPEYDWTPASTSFQYLPLFNPTDQPPLPLPLPAFSRPFSSNAPMSHTPFPLPLSLPGARMLTNHPDGPPAPATATQPAIDAQKDTARPPSAPPPSIRRSSRSHLKSGERGSDRDSTGDDPDAIDDVPTAVVTDPSVSRIRRTWASVYEDDVLTSDESVPLSSPFAALIFLY